MHLKKVKKKKKKKFNEGARKMKKECGEEDTHILLCVCV